MLGGSCFMRALRAEAPTLTRRFFSCHSRQARSTQTKPLRDISSNGFVTSKATSPASCLAKKSIRPSLLLASRRAFSSATNRRSAIAVSSTSSSDGLITTVPKGYIKDSAFPEQTDNAVGYWLLASAASVFGLVIFGGLTRLTESGLSITEWRPVTGSLPPMNDADWESEFLKYKSSPEFAMLNSRMTLEEFKSIYWMEWIHRLWGRAVGLTFVLPAIYFTARFRMSKEMTVKVWTIASLIGFQGFLGWWMVKSGLKDDLFAPGSTPRVSQYRLAAHLGTAFVVYLSMFSSGLTILRDNRLIKTAQSEMSQTLIKAFRSRPLLKFRIVAIALTALVFTTAMSGAFVAGLDAGLIYNEFPWMGQGLTPPKSELFDPFYSHVEPNESGKYSDLIWRNMFENPSLVQLDHRILATTTFSAIVALFAWSRYSKTLRRQLPQPAKRALHGVLGFASLQVVLGISTLWYLVPTYLASAHQAGALALLTWMFVLSSRIRASRSSMTLLERAVTQTLSSSPVQRVSVRKRIDVAFPKEEMVVWEVPKVPKVRPQVVQQVETEAAQGFAVRKVQSSTARKTAAAKGVEVNKAHPHTERSSTKKTRSGFH